MLTEAACEKSCENPGPFPGPAKKLPAMSRKKNESPGHTRDVKVVGKVTIYNYPREKRGLQQRWAALGVPLVWPLQANTADREPFPVARDGINPTDVLPPAAATFVEDVCRFMRKWNVMSLVTWDLPLSQGPLESIPTGLARHLLGPDQPVSVYPSYFDIPSTQDVRAEIRAQQEAAARSAGIGNDFPRTDLSSRAGRPSEPDTRAR
jgi:hypothetical protein